jgi:Ca2+-binding RTX toxin-like protein
MSSIDSTYIGIEGYGAGATGGLGGAIIHVTNLNDSGAGSLRAALEASGTRTIVFDVSGSIDLKSQILVTNGDVTIAGQTAPGEGITLQDDRIRIKASDVVIQGLKFRPGDENDGASADDRDGLMIGTTDFTVKDVVVDHCSFSWSVDENLTINGSVANVTISNNIVAEGLSHSLHSKGEHSKGMLISNWSQTGGDEDNHITVTKNLFADNMDRNPEIRAGQEIEIVNNYIYGAGRYDRSIAIGGGTNGTLDTTVHVIGNVIDAGAGSTNTSKNPISLTTMGALSAVYLEDNLAVERKTDAAGNQVQTSLVNNTGGAKYVTSTEAFQSSNVTVLDSTQVADHVLANAGANPFARDSIDARIVESVIEGTGKLVDTTASVGGQSTTAPVKAAQDFDRDGMPDWFENLYGLDAKTADSWADKDRDGHSNMAEYLAGLYGGFDMAVAKQLVGDVATTGKADVIAVAPATGAVHVVQGFSLAEGDRLDLGGFILDSSKGGSLADYVEVSQALGSTFVSIDRDGAGTKYTSEVVAEIIGLTGVTDVSRIVSISRADATAIVDGVVVAAAAAAAPKVIEGTAGVDRLTGTDRADILWGYDGADRISAGGGDDVVYGGAGNDWIEGGAGSDRMVGGAGDDTYVVTESTDTVVETAADGSDTGGNDRVVSTVSFHLSANVERLQLNGTADLDGWGNDGANDITGNDGANRLYGGDGKDTLRGGAGNDLLDGGNGDDSLDGGSGADVMRGGAGNDLYYVDDKNDVVDESNGTGGDAGGTDTVRSVIDFALSATVENLTLQGTGDLNGWGNALNNSLIGNGGNNHLWGFAGNDTLNGGAGNDVLDGGAGSDVLIGGTGADLFVFSVAPVKGTIDKISDYTSGEDRISLTASAFHGLAASSGVLAASSFALGTKATSTAAQIVYDKASGKLYYDTDGTGSAAAIQFASVTAGTQLTHADFLLG